ncbi:DUF4168 domain-containing protein [Frigidibacter albus]|uniref:DUF4168 domain-containing protein n=1 Tax=Frigidibacter albus TaxID=1465486 RepID=A0A6L8VMF7_9RHOB|nr:DUF4168 domain-containing protein [Frigidibacter albus]MZQ91264.1 DUF4168 domain-containing protein [Frigidibacter albus]NBE33199.1 DUF4168 domain-containing protein [Frigidibacter albus]GGH63752.1 hypothetical protein GCM10011341_39130 [Frigidibacter albus]
MSISKILATAITAATITASPLVLAPAMAQQTIDPASVSDSELDAFVVAYEEVAAVEQDYGARLQQADGEAEKQAIVTEAQAKMTQAIEETPNIEVDRYVEILQLAQVDTDLQAELTAKLQD